MDTFQERLKHAMSIRQMTATELSEKTGINKGSISCYRNGRYKANQSNTYLLAKELNVDETWLMGYDVPMERYDDSQFDDSFPIPSSNYVFDPEVKKLLRLIEITAGSVTDLNERKKVVKVLSNCLDSLIFLDKE